MLDLRNYLTLEDEYIIIRMNDLFPSYEHRSDIDIVCLDSKYLATKIKDRHKGKLIEHFPEGHHHLDYHNAQGLNLKFDLIDNFNYFSKVKINENFKTELFQNVKIIERNQHMWRVPSDNYETVIRYIEWVEYPHKVKHKNFYDSNVNDTVEDIIKRNLKI